MNRTLAGLRGRPTSLTFTPSPQSILKKTSKRTVPARSIGRLTGKVGCTAELQSDLAPSASPTRKALGLGLEVFASGLPSSGQVLKSFLPGLLPRKIPASRQDTGGEGKGSWNLHLHHPCWNTERQGGLCVKLGAKLVSVGV